MLSISDLKDLEMLLEQTEGTGIDVYTHSEMLEHTGLSAFKNILTSEETMEMHGGNKKEEFESFHGPILMTTNCIVPPKDSYKNVFTQPERFVIRDARTSTASSVIQKISLCSSNRQSTAHRRRNSSREPLSEASPMHRYSPWADQIVDAVKSGAIKKFVVMAGCDGRAKSRSYYSDFAQALPKDTVILTAGCAKYKYNKLNLGDINGIPRVLDAGQCNDSYSLAVIALKLKEVFGLDDINDLPIIYNISWYEQKAVIVLLALLSLGVKNIHLGPTLPAFLSPNVAALLVENFGIAGIDTVENDMELFFGK